jgi:AcrR family transcriptional regulator
MSNALADPARQRAEATRTRIAETAERLFRSMGYQKTAVADIARELGMSPANVYRFFPSKSAINEAIAERLLAGLEQAVRDLAAADRPAPERLRAIARHLFERGLVLFIQERRMHDMVTAAMGEHWGVIQRFIETVEQAFRDVLRDGAARGEFAPLDPERTARAIKQGLMLWTHPALVAECLAHQQATEAEMAEHLEDYLDLLLRALRPDG